MGCRRSVLALVVLALNGSAGCGESGAVHTGLTGTWVLELQLESSEFRERPRTRQLSGTLTLAVVAPDSGRWVGTHPATHHGRARLDFRPFGFGERPWENVGSTSILGDVLSQADVAHAVDWPDGIQIVINPAVSHGGLWLDGRWRDADIEGTWIVPGFV